MGARFRARRHLVDDVVTGVARWARTQDDVRACVVVGSYARGRPRMGSDVDIVILTTHPHRHLENPALLERVTPAGRLIRSAQWGAVHERRVRLPEGLHVELNFTPPSWAAMPLDPGTARVLLGGCRILIDDGSVARAVSALGRAPTPWRNTELRSHSEGGPGGTP